MKKRFFIYLLLGMLVSTSWMTGCKKPTGTFPVTGTLTLDGQPLDNARVTFSPANPSSGTVASGSSNDKGEFTIKTQIGHPGTTPGEYVVVVKKIIEEWDGKSYRESYVLENGTKKEQVKDVKVKQILHKAYTTKESTPLKATVTADETKNKFTFELKSKL